MACGAETGARGAVPAGGLYTAPADGAGHPQLDHAKGPVSAVVGPLDVEVLGEQQDLVGR